jgi:hypothetical protein
VLIETCPGDAVIAHTEQEKKEFFFNEKVNMTTPHPQLAEVWSPLQAILSTCMGSFTCPGIDAQVQGTTVL